MRKKSIIFVILILSCSLMGDQLFAKFKMFGLEKAKKKVEKALSDKIKQSKDAVKNAIKKTKDNIENVFSKKKNNNNELVKTISPVGTLVVDGLDIYDIELEKKLKKTNKFLEKLKWGVDSKFISSLKTAYSKSKEEAQKVLYEKLVQTYSGSKKPLISFVVELEHELEKVEQHFNSLLTSFDQKIKVKDKKKIEKLEEFIEKLTQIKEDIEWLTNVTNELLFS